MIWQDAVIAVGLVVINGSMIPTITGPHKPAIITTIIMAIITLAYAVSFATLDIRFSALFELINAIEWAIIAVQILRSRHAGVNVMVTSSTFNRVV